MDQKFSKSRSGRVSMKAVFASLLIMLSCSLSASTNYNGGSDEPGVTITSTGVVNGEMVFKLVYGNEQADLLEIAITDNSGSRLYRKLSNDKNINTIFKIPADLGTVYLTVTNTKDKTQKRFQISSQERTVEKLVIGSVR